MFNCISAIAIYHFVWLALFGFALLVNVQKTKKNKTAKNCSLLPKIFNLSNPQKDLVPTDGTFESVIINSSRCLIRLNIGPMVIEDGPRTIRTRVALSMNSTGIVVNSPVNFNCINLSSRKTPHERRHSK